MGLEASRQAYSFLSTPSARRATGRRDHKTTGGSISIHALREEGDRQEVRLDLRRRRISIHALREEGDYLFGRDKQGFQHFYPRPPRGGRLKFTYGLTYFTKFLSTPSARRATADGAERTPRRNHFYPRPPRGGRHQARQHRHRRLEISIHALREEGDPFAVWALFLFQYFYPRPPRGGRPKLTFIPLDLCTFLSTPSARRATVDTITKNQEENNFYPRPPRGGRRYVLERIGILSKFLSTPSARRATGSRIITVWA